jgi:hypothetical protein
MVLLVAGIGLAWLTFRAERDARKDAAIEARPTSSPDA